MYYRLLLVLLSLILGIGKSKADDRLIVRDMALTQNGKGTLVIETAFDSDVFFGYQFEVVLPKGLTITLDENGKPIAESHTALEIVGSVLLATDEAITFQFIASKMGNPRIPQGNYVLATMPIETDGTLEVGDVLECRVSEILFSDGTQTGKDMDDCNFTVTITDRVTLDESSTTAPAATDGKVNVLVRRTISAGNWNTLVLPFAMTAEQVTAAFGEDVKLADFMGVETTKDEEENVTSMKVNFVQATAIEANHPYLIKVVNAITEFPVEGVIINPEAEPSVDRDEMKVKVGKTTYTFYNRFVGTYVAGTTVEAQMLFLNGNKFYYSDGTVTMKAFRAYFDFYDVLTDVENGVKLNIMVDGEETHIGDVKHERVNSEKCFDLTGRKVRQAIKGVYIMDGRKVMVK